MTTLKAAFFLSIFAVTTIHIGSAATEAAKTEKTPLYSHAHTSCDLNGKKWELHLGDFSQADNDEAKEFGYTTFWIQPAGGAPKIIGFPVKPYTTMLFLSSHTPSICADTPAFKTADGTIGIFVRVENRPFNDKLAVVFFDPEKNQIVAQNQDLGISEQVEPTPNGLAYRVYDPASDYENYTVEVRGKSLKASEETFAFWQTIDRTKSRVVGVANADLTWQRSNYKSYFKSQADFEKAFGWDSRHHLYKNIWIYRTENPACLQAAKERAPLKGDTHWNCGSL